MRGRRTYDLVLHPSGAVYESILDTAAHFSALIGLIVQSGRTKLQPTAHTVFHALEPFLVRDEEVASWPGSQLYGGYTSRRLLYTLHPEALNVLLTTTTDLFAWVNPALPEDLHFLRADLSTVLGSTAQHDDAWLELDELERVEWARIAPLAAMTAVNFD